MNNASLLLTFSLVAVAMAISYREKIGLERDLLIGSLRAVAQLTAIGFVLTYIFSVDQVWLTTILLLAMVYNAALVAAKRGAGIARARWISFVAISVGLVVTLGGLLLFQTIAYRPSEVIPVSGMVVGNSMVAIGLLFRNLASNFQSRREEVEVKLCLGAPPQEAARNLIRESMRVAAQPTVDGMKTLGIVQLPGMMTGLILAGVEPQEAIKYQIMVAFMLAGAVSVTAFVASYWAYRSFFTPQAQLRE